MPRKETLKDVPEAQVDEIAKDYESEGATVERKKQDGGWTIIATLSA